MSNTFTNSENVWIIDPISNTLNFIHGLPHYSVVLSHVYKSELLFAVVYDPSTQEMFTAEKGKGAFLNDIKISVSNNSPV
jgi:myo-inositol-1(or 4)-monophosphatase